MPRIQSLLLSLTVFTCLSFVGCSGCSDDNGNNNSGNGNSENGLEIVPAPMPKSETIVDDEGWTTVVTDPLGSSEAVKGGTMTTNIPGWPENLRSYGTGSNTYLNSIVEGLCYESLLTISPYSLEFLPSLASHWKISDDKMTFSFRLNPKAKWSDGKPVVADDVIATYRLMADDTLRDPLRKAVVVDKMHEPVKISDHEIEIKCKVKDWRNFITISGLVVLPAHEIGDLTGEEYLEKFNFSYTATSGPYIVDPADIKKNESLTVTRRNDYWAADDPANEGLYNLGKIRFVVIRDQRLAFDKALAGELDFYPVYTAKWWVEDTDPKACEPVAKGQLIRQKVFTRFPQGYQGMAFNMRKAPLDDVRVRKALAHLYNRKQMLEKFAYNEYERLKSYYPNSDYEDHENKLVEFDPQAAADLLKEAGWSKRGDDGILVKGGKRLSLTIQYRSKGFEKYLTSFQADAKKAGVEIQLSQQTPETHWKNMMERKFEIAGMNWAAILFPNPRGSFHSTMAGKNDNNNITGFKSDIVDELIEEYDKEFDQKKREGLLRKMDAEIFKSHHYSLEWYVPCERILYWNKFGTPQTVLPKYGDWREVFAYWWVDPQKKDALKDSRIKGNSITPIPPVIVKPWDATAEEGESDETDTDAEPETASR